MIVDIARQITDEKIIPQRAELDEKEEFATEILNEIAQADLYGLYIPEEYGGFGGGCFEVVLPWSNSGVDVLQLRQALLPAPWGFIQYYCPAVKK